MIEPTFVPPPQEPMTPERAQEALRRQIADLECQVAALQRTIADQQKRINELTHDSRNQ